MAKKALKKVQTETPAEAITPPVAAPTLMPAAAGDWIVNAQRGQYADGKWRGVDIVEGPPVGTKKFSADELAAKGLVGIYFLKNVRG